MSFGFPAYHEQEVLHARDLEEARSRAKRAANTLRWQFVREADEDLVFRVGINWRSWGEEVKIIFRPGRVLLHSKCRWFSQCFDWGKNRRNCQDIAKAYES